MKDVRLSVVYDEARIFNHVRYLVHIIAPTCLVWCFAIHVSSLKSIKVLAVRGITLR